MKAKYQIGQKFIAKTKRKDIETITDIFYTYNSKNELIKLEYLCEYDFCGQRITHILPQMTIARAEAEGRLI